MVDLLEEMSRNAARGNPRRAEERSIDAGKRRQAQTTAARLKNRAMNHRGGSAKGQTPKKLRIEPVATAEGSLRRGTSESVE